LADRVIIVDVRRANEELRPRDIQQMMGRSGRVHGKSNESDVHLIVLNRDLVRWKKKLDNPSSYEIRSNLNDVSVFAFHVISHIVRGLITGKDSFYGWYDRTLDKFQRESRGEDIPKYHDIAQELHETGAAEYDATTGEIKPKPLGKICAAYYFSPYDVRDWFRNICELHRRDLMFNDAAQAWALSNITSAMEWDNDVLRMHAENLTDQIAAHRLPVKKGITARLLATDCALSGKRPRCDLPVFYSVKNDLSRILTAWEAIGKVSRRALGDITSFVETMQIRHKHGVPTKYTRLVQLPGIGKTTAKTLCDSYDIQTPAELKAQLDFVYEHASSGIKRSLTNYKKHLEKVKDSKSPKVSYKSGKRTREGRDEFGDL
jgi:replicative superfamily II helicase